MNQDKLPFPAISIYRGESTKSYILKVRNYDFSLPEWTCVMILSNDANDEVAYEKTISYDQSSEGYPIVLDTAETSGLPAGDFTFSVFVNNVQELFSREVIRSKLYLRNF